MNTDSMQLVTIESGEARTTTLAIAEGTGNEHRAVIQLTRRFKGDLEEFGGVAFEMRPFQTAGGTQRREIATLNEPQATLLMTYMKNTPIIREFKKRLVKAFYEMKNISARPQQDHEEHYTISPNRYIELLESENRHLRVQRAEWAIQIKELKQAATVKSIAKSESDRSDEQPVNNVLTKRFIELYGDRGNVRKFWKEKNIPYSYFTVVKAIHQGAKLSAPVFAVIASSLDFAKDEIIAMLAEAGDLKGLMELDMMGTIN